MLKAVLWLVVGSIAVAWAPPPQKHHIPQQNGRPMLIMSELAQLASRLAENPDYDSGDDVQLIAKLANMYSLKDSFSRAERQRLLDMLVYLSKTPPIITQGDSDA